MLFRQFVDEDLGCASYLVADAETGEAALVDPAYAIEQYLEAAKREGVRIVRVLETHTHADHVSGHGRLALEHDVPVSVHEAAEAEYRHDPLSEGAEVEVGSLQVRCLHTPGHRPEHCCFLVDSMRRLLELPDDVRVFPGHVAGSLCGTGMSSDPSSTIGAERRGNALLA